MKIRCSASTLSFAVALVLGATGCVDKEKCNEAIAVTRDALAKEQTDLARQWRDYAWKLCDDPAMTAGLDQEIVAKEAELKKRAEDKAKEIRDAAQQRLKAAGTIWAKFSKLDEKQQTEEQLERYRKKAEQMKKDLPDEYAKQVDEYNEKLYAKLKKRVESEK